MLMIRPLLPLHRRQARLREAAHRSEVQRPGLLPDRVGGVRRRGPGAARVVDEDVEAAELRQGLRHDGPGRPRVRDVERHRQGGRPAGGHDLLLERLQQAFPARAHHCSDESIAGDKSGRPEGR
jgi:hypothetical protein